MRFGTLVLVLLGLPFLAACTTVGRKIDTAAVDRIQKGKTTRQEVLASVGAPDQVSRDGDGNTTYMYMYARSEAKPASFIPYIGPLVGGTKSQNQTVMVTFNADNIVTDIHSTMGGMETSDNLSAGSKAKITETEENKRPK